MKKALHHPMREFTSLLLDHILMSALRYCMINKAMFPEMLMMRFSPHYDSALNLVYLPSLSYKDVISLDNFRFQVILFIGWLLRIH